MKKVVIGLMMVFSLSLASVGSADPGIMFGVADDLAVFGTNGTGATPDVGIKGFTVFGSTQATYPGPVQSGAGNVVVNGALNVSSGAYIIGGSTITGGAYFVNSSTFASTINVSSPTAVYLGGGAIDQVLKKDASGSLKWAADNTGPASLGTIARRLQMLNNSLDGLIDSVFQQNAANTNITMLATSSMTVLGAFEADGAATLASTLLVNSNSQLGNLETADIHGINMAPVSSVALAVKGDPATGGTKYVVQFYSGATLAAWIVKE